MNRFVGLDKCAPFLGVAGRTNSVGVVNAPDFVSCLDGVDGGTARTLSQTADGKSACGRGLLLIATLSLCLLLFSAVFVRDAFAVEHIDSSKTGSLTMTCEYDQVPLKGLSFDLWHVASVASDGSYQLDSEFANCGVDLGSLELSSEWDAAARVMYGVAVGSGSAGASDGSPSAGRASSSAAGALPATAHDVSGSTGHVWFGSLKPGLYLVSASELVKGKKRYVVSPCLVAVPHLDGTGSTWIYNVRAVPKIEEKDNKGDKPGSNPGGSDKPGSGGDAGDGSGNGSSSAGAGSASSGSGGESASSSAGSSQSGLAGFASGLAQTGESAVPFVVLLILICASVAVLVATRKRK